MGLLDKMGDALGALGGNEESNIGQALLGMLQEEGGGLQGLQSLLEENGLSDVVSSWVGTGDNRPISADQLLSALGDGRIGQLAERAGVGAGELPQKLAELLPALVDKLTPGGEMPDANSLLQAGVDLLKSRLA